ncbi:hypothetical protein SEA_JEEVES_47 [Mycobacterium phage Jeeves]|uniref:Uncharacterized protein n=1 Tax=Mycobacterium phage Jeeves TaxID=2652402 RepID=A0A5J6T5R1_9CAUD|nr:hypothetical protein KNU75_gp062 [Mycobacterium phage Jeeves]QFG04522.1 hypothetical protein SEA_JEEVES_47 [Mycobacterium phage Jeeves]
MIPFWPSEPLITARRDEEGTVVLTLEIRVAEELLDEVRQLPEIAQALEAL